MIINQEINIGRKKEVEIKKGKESGKKRDIHTTAIPDVPMKEIETGIEIVRGTEIEKEIENIVEVISIQNIKIQNLVIVALRNIKVKEANQVHLRILTQIPRIILNLNQNQILI